MSLGRNGTGQVTIRRHDPIKPFTMGGIVQDAGLTVEVRGPAVLDDRMIDNLFKGSTGALLRIWHSGP